MEKTFFDNLKQGFGNSPIQYVNMAGIVPEVLEERHVRLLLPIDPLHKNHVGTAYAGSMFTMAEISGANLFMCSYGDAYVPVLKSVEVAYTKPATKDLVVDIALTEEEAESKIALAKERGRGDYFLDVPICDIDGNQVALAKFNYYAFSAEKISEFGSK